MEHGPDCDEEYCDAIEDEPECDAPDGHEWTGEGCGGIESNPGVWSLGGTTHKFRERCTRCGVHRIEVHRGSQRNATECDTRRYVRAGEE